MALIHELSNETPLPMLDLWKVPFTQKSIERTTVREIRPLSVPRSDAPIEFVFTTSPEQYLMLGETYLSLRVKVTLYDSKNKLALQSNMQKVKVAKNFFHSLFKSVSLTINDKVLTLSPNDYAYKVFIENLFGFSEHAKKAHLTAEEYTTNVVKEEIIPAFIEEPDDNSLNAGKATPTKADSLVRVEKQSVANIMELLGRLHLDLTFQELAIVGGCTIKIRLIPNDASFFLQWPDEHRPKVEFERVSLFATVALATPTLLEKHLKAWNTSPVKYFFTRPDVKTHSLAFGTRDYNINNFIFGQLPRRILMFIVANENYNGTKDTDPFDIVHCNLNHISISINGMIHPEHVYEPDFDDGMYTIPYIGLYRTLNQNDTDCYYVCSKAQFAQHPIFAFQLSADLSNGSALGGHLSPIQNGVLNINLRFKGPLMGVYSLIAYCEFDNCIQIDNNGTVATDYN